MKNFNNKPLISVTINLYNYGRFIKDCISSVLNQTYSNFELIIVDDCSTDNSYEVAKKFEKKDHRVRVIRLDKNGGIGKAKNEGIVRAKGEYIVTLDADDMMTKNSLKLRIQRALKYNIYFVHANAILIDGRYTLDDCYKIKKTFPAPGYPRLLYCPDVYNINAQSVLIHRIVYEKYGLYDEDLKGRIDREMWWRLFGKSDKDKNKINSYFLNKPVAYYRWHSKQITKKRSKNKKLDKLIKYDSEQKYLIRKLQGITRENTRFLEQYI